MSLFKHIVSSPRPETIAPILVTAGFEFLYLKTGESRVPITLAPESLPELIDALTEADHARSHAREKGNAL